eukprot:PITA_24137
MKGISFNCRGLVSPDKKLALRRLCLSEKLDFLLLQETLDDGPLVNKALKSFLPDWDFFFLDVRGRSGGCALGFNNKMFRISNSWGGKGFLGVDFTSISLNIPMRIINIYGPCQNKEVFWENMLQVDFIQESQNGEGCPGLKAQPFPNQIPITKSPCTHSSMGCFTSLQGKEHLINLEKEKIRLLGRNEETWWLKSRALCLKSGDQNTIFFQKFAKGRKAINTIWELKDHTGREASSFTQLADMGVRHFSNIYKNPRGTNIAEILQVAEAMPRFVEEEEEDYLN